MSRPITPAEARQQKLNSIPEFVIEAVNKLIVKKMSPNSKSVTLLQEDIIEQIEIEGERMQAWKSGGFNRNRVFEEHWLDFEDIFRQAGWDVEYDKPAYCESYEPNFKFRVRVKEGCGWYKD